MTERVAASAASGGVRPPANGGEHPPLEREAAQGLVSWLYEEPRLRILVKADGEAVWMSRAAQALPPDIFPFAPASPGGGRRLEQTLVNRITYLDDERPHYLACTDGRDWVIWAQAISTGTGDGSAGHGLIGLTLRRRGETPELEALAQACHLTRAEVRIIAALMAGQDTATAARGLGISLHTLRTHVRHAYRKLGVTTREGLFAGALVFMQP